MATPGPANPETVSVKVKTLINSQLKQILKKEGLLVSGAKATLQSRIIDRESRLPYDFACTLRMRRNYALAHAILSSSIASL